MNDFKHFSNWLPNAIAKYNMGRETRAALICERFRNLAPTIIGESAMEHIQPKCFKGGVLYISVPDSLWAQQIYVHRHDLMIKLNLNLDKDWVHDIRTNVGKIEQVWVP